jgi:hypothetical protein
MDGHRPSAHVADPIVPGFAKLGIKTSTIVSDEGFDTINAFTNLFTATDMHFGRVRMHQDVADGLLKNPQRMQRICGAKPRGGGMLQQPRRSPGPLLSDRLA